MAVTSIYFEENLTVLICYIYNMTNIQSKSLMPFCKFINKMTSRVSIFYMHCVRQLSIHILYIDDVCMFVSVYLCTYVHIYVHTYPS